MTPRDVTGIYRALQARGVRVWIDGGWCVEALAGRSIREHSDLDLAVERGEEGQLRAWFAAEGFTPVAREGSSEWCYVVRRGDRVVDVHVFEYDGAGGNIYGIAYPSGSLAGRGVLDGVEVECVAAPWMLKFKTAYPPAEKDRLDVRALCERFAWPVPPGYG
jgi:lincosamide nucleotidyltransferase A/C/D/E